MNGKVIVWLFPALLGATLIVLGWFGVIVSNLDAKVYGLAITQERNNTLLKLLEQRFLK